MSLTIRPFQIEDYPQAYALWQVTEGIGLSSADSREAIERFLKANPGLSMAAFDESELVGAVLCSTDGRRGYLHHLAVRLQSRRQGLGRALVERCLSALGRLGIQKCHIFVFRGNQEGFVFWENAGFQRRMDIMVMSREIGKDA